MKIIKSKPHPSLICNVLDVEASGLGSDSYPIEIGVVMASGQKYQALIKPVSGWTQWTEEAYAMHGIDRQMLQTRGLSVHVVCAELNDLCRGQTLYSDCWVNDLPWILKLFAQAGIYPKFKCSPIELILKESQFKNWAKHKQETIQATGIKPHRALNDADIIARTIQTLVGSTKTGTRKRINKQPEAVTPFRKGMYSGEFTPAQC